MGMPSIEDTRAVPLPADPSRQDATDSGDGHGSLMRPVPIVRITAAGRESLVDQVVREVRFDLHLNGRHLVALVCLPSELKAFVVGFLVNEGILVEANAVQVVIDLDEGRIDARGAFDPEVVEGFRSKQTLTSGCGSGVAGRAFDRPGRCLKVTSDLFVRPETIATFMRVLRDEASLYRSTGGAHIAALGDGQGQLIAAAEDIGRHTAVDKVIGKALLAGHDPRRCVLFCSGRLSSEITAKAIHAGVPVLVSRAAPTDLSVRLARHYLLTLIGFARGQRMNVYSVAERILGA